ncbi:hypothetical protein [Massilia sp. Dwa41.01b]|uniref:hypothetical protein n=1 Tax=Massilia sp. Dwa41.01b TaxID=2709302 RepID=UPI0023DD9173|nr:hypothetical protein [Massilia sp. Dwa41.01b]
MRASVRRRPAGRAHRETLPVTPVAAGELLVLGPEHALRAIAAPGHADDQIVFHDKRRARLFASDALGERNEASGAWHPLVFDDYSRYRAPWRHWAPCRCVS